MSKIQKRETHPLYYVALGDSLTVGVGVPIFTRAFVDQYLELSEQALNHNIYLTIFAKVEATTEEILQWLSLPEVAVKVSHSDIITLTAGANDLIHAAEAFLITKSTKDFNDALNKSIKNIARIIDKIHALNPLQKYTYLIRLLNLYNPFPDIPEADSWIQNFNARLKMFSKIPHIGVADIYHPFAGRQKELLSIDNVHPNAMGYKVMAESTYQLGYDHFLQ
ncbi:GDSL-type esterase/lipase family protein [Bacillus xiapuensis]|uniref:GDSL-type esterase/lipase family protein n=1 Tax=Bacillus xiapuensis TaxID=2014075 RepID=A0ABU6NHK9_9BACI|nr:GDSL-type esterase/lipase family protein [Bacillus xiapuensis]